MAASYTPKPLLPSILLLLVVLAAKSQVAWSRPPICTSNLGQLRTCARFIVPGQAGPPSQECCDAIGNLEHSCVCETLNVIARLPGRCNLPPVASCGSR